jgi:hypothetical protein
VLCTSNPQSFHIVVEHCYAVVGYNPAAGDPFEIFDLWSTQSNGYAPNTNKQIYRLFIAEAPFIPEAQDDPAPQALNIEAQELTFV